MVKICNKKKRMRKKLTKNQIKADERNGFDWFNVNGKKVYQEKEENCNEKKGFTQK